MISQLTRCCREANWIVSIVLYCVDCLLCYILCVCLVSAGVLLDGLQFNTEQTHSSEVATTRSRSIGTFLKCIAPTCSVIYIYNYSHVRDGFTIDCSQLL